MKKNLKVILFSCVIGTVLATVFFLNIKEKAEAKNREIAYAFQVGVFKSEQNAENIKNNYSFAKVVKDSEYYRVFIGITSSNKETLEKIFENKGYNYYVKEISIPEETLNEIKKYDTLFAKTSEENKGFVIRNMLESLPDEL